MTYHFNVSILLLRERGKWVAQCLEYDIATQGDSLVAVKKSFEKTFVGQILVDIHSKKQPLEGIAQAPDNYWKRFEAAERLTDRKPFRIPNGIPPAFMIQASAGDMRISA